MNTPLRIASAAATLTLALSTAAGAATMRLVPLSPTTAGASITSCAAPFAPAALTAAAPAELPEIAAGQHVDGVSKVRIVLDGSGRLAEQSVLASSGNPWLDQAALRAARLSRYRAEVRDCAPVGGTYALVVDFTR